MADHERGKWLVSALNRTWNYTPFAFKSPEYESAFQSWYAKRMFRPACTMHATVVFGWLAILLLYIISPAQTRQGFPFIAPAITLTLGPAMWLLGNAVTHPATVSHAYAANWRVYNAAAAALQVIQSRTVRDVIFWIQGEYHADRGPSIGRSMQSFLVENPLFAFAVGRTIAWPTGVVTDVMLALADLAWEMTHNPNVCSGQGIMAGYNPNAGQGMMAGYRLVSLSGWFAYAAHGLSAAMLMVYGAAPSPLLSTPDEMSCTAILAFWQVLAVLLIGVASVGKEVFSRRAFLQLEGLRENSARDRDLGPARGSQAENYVPEMRLEDVCLVLSWLVLGHITLWAGVLAYELSR